MNDMNPAAPAARPTFLTVLCILSFIGGALGIFNGITTLMTPPLDQAMSELQAEMDKASAELGDQSAMVSNMMDGAMEIARKTAENAMPLGLAAIVLSALSLFGVWKMWNLQKQGFTIYTLASILGLITPLVFLGFSMLSIMSLGVGGFFSVLFIILYALNLKHMH